MKPLSFIFTLSLLAQPLIAQTQNTDEFRKAYDELLQCCSRNDFAKAQELLAGNPELINPCPKCIHWNNVKTPLAYACRFCSPKAVEFLISRGAKVNALAHEADQAPIHSAVRHIFLEDANNPGWDLWNSAVEKQIEALEITKILLDNEANPLAKEERCTVIDNMHRLNVFFKKHSKELNINKLFLTNFAKMINLLDNALNDDENHFSDYSYDIECCDPEYEDEYEDSLCEDCLSKSN